MAGNRRKSSQGKNSRRAAHLQRYRFKAGQSGNPDGRPRGTREFAELIAGETRGGEELVEFALKVFRGEEEFRSEDQWNAMRWAAEYLTERMLGRAPQTIELTGKDGGPIEYSGARERLIERLSAIMAVRVEGLAKGAAALQLEAGAPKPS